MTEEPMGGWPKTISVCPHCTGLLVGEWDEDGGWRCYECQSEFNEPVDVSVLPAEIAWDLVKALDRVKDEVGRVPDTGTKVDGAAAVHAIGYIEGVVEKALANHHSARSND